MSDMSDNSAMERVTIRRLSRETNRVIEEAVRGGKPVVVTVYGRPAVALVPLKGRIEDIPKLGLEGAPEHVLGAYREAQADIVAGRLLAGHQGGDVAQSSGTGFYHPAVSDPD